MPIFLMRYHRVMVHAVLQYGAVSSRILHSRKRSAYSHFFHLKNKIGSTAASTISVSAKG